MQDIPECFYRVSIKALVLNEAKDKFLITQEPDGRWDIPGGGLDYNTTPQEDLPREIKEEMGLRVVSVATHPSYFLTFERTKGACWCVNVLYETVLENLNFTPSDECVAIKYVNKNNVGGLRLFSSLVVFLDMFDPKKHQIVTT